MINNEVELVVVEDSSTDAELITRVFKKYNLVNKVTVLQDGAEALDFFFRDDSVNVPNRLIILDLKLPKVSGIEVLRRLKSDDRTKSTPIVILTSSREERDLKESYISGVNSYVTKPISFNEFSKVLADLGMYWLVINKPPI